MVDPWIQDPPKVTAILNFSMSKKATLEFAYFLDGAK